MLVSHWAVDSAAATRLTTLTFDALKNEPKLGRAEALRRAKLAYLDDANSPMNAYPAFWAPSLWLVKDRRGSSHRSVNGTPLTGVPPEPSQSLAAAIKGELTRFSNPDLFHVA